MAQAGSFRFGGARRSSSNRNRINTYQTQRYQAARQRSTRGGEQGGYYRQAQSRNTQQRAYNQYQQQQRAMRQADPGWKVSNAIQQAAQWTNRMVGRAGQAVREMGKPVIDPAAKAIDATAAATPEERQKALFQFAWRNNPGRVNPNTPQFAGYQEQLRQQREHEAKGEIFGVHYGPNWRRADYIPPHDYLTRQGDIMMTNDEYIRRQNAREKMWQPGLADWIGKAAATPNVGHEIETYRLDPWGRKIPLSQGQWLLDNPKPAGFFQLPQEYILRQNAAPPGTIYKPFGTPYVEIPTMEDWQAPPNNDQGGGGGGGGWGDWGWGGGGGGGGGWDPVEELRSWYNGMVNWSINTPRGG